MKMLTAPPSALRNALAAGLRAYFPEVTGDAMLAALKAYDPDAAAVPAEPAPTLLTRREVAAALRCSLPTVHRLMDDGTLPRVRVLGKVLIRESDVLALIGEGEGAA